MVDFLFVQNISKMNVSNNNNGRSQTGSLIRDKYFVSIDKHHNLPHLTTILIISYMINIMSHFENIFCQTRPALCFYLFFK